MTSDRPESIYEDAPEVSERCMERASRFLSYKPRTRHELIKQTENCIRQLGKLCDAYVQLQTTLKRKSEGYKVSLAEYNEIYRRSQEQHVAANRELKELDIPGREPYAVGPLLDLPQGLDVPVIILLAEHAAELGIVRDLDLRLFELIDTLDIKTVDHVFYLLLIIHMLYSSSWESRISSASRTAR